MRRGSRHAGRALGATGVPQRQSDQFRRRRLCRSRLRAFTRAAASFVGDLRDRRQDLGRWSAIVIGDSRAWWTALRELARDGASCAGLSAMTCDR